MNNIIKQKMLDVKNVGDLISLDKSFETPDNKEMLLFVSVNDYMENVELFEGKDEKIDVVVGGMIESVSPNTEVIVRTTSNRITYQMYIKGESLSIMPVVTIVP